MKKFNSLFKAGKTKVQLEGEYGYRTVQSIHETKNWVEIQGLEGSFQRTHIVSFTNKDNVEMYPTLDDLFRVEAGTVFKRGSNECICIGKLNGRTLKQFIKDQGKWCLVD